jgi:FkbM family methyltransferase
MGYPKGDPIAYLQSVLKPGDVVIDGGANAGSVTEKCAQIVGPSGVVIAIEPDPRCHDALEALATTYPCVQVIFAALTDGHRPTPFYQAQNTTQSSRIQGTVTQPLEGAEPLTVSSVTLDSLRYTPTAVKLDLQGGEPDAIAGGWGMLRLCDHWVVELWPSAIEKAGSSPAALIGAFRKAGLTPYWMTDPLTPCELDQPEKWCREAGAPHQFVNIVFHR